MMNDRDEIIILDDQNIPRHIGIILDGNGRWAKKRHLPRLSGHKEGALQVKTILKEAAEIGVEYVSLYAFSSENWKRPEKEVNGLMSLLVTFVQDYLEEAVKNNFVITTMGDVSKLPEKTLNAIEKACLETKDNTGLVVNLGLNYGSRNEIIKAVNNIIEEKEKGLYPRKITAEEFENHLYTKNMPELDLLIRPGGEQRLSNFMLYQLAYAELYFTDVLWPDFSEKELRKAIFEFQNRERRYGGLK